MPLVILVVLVGGRQLASPSVNCPPVSISISLIIIFNKKKKRRERKRRVKKRVVFRRRKQSKVQWSFNFLLCFRLSFSYISFIHTNIKLKLSLSLYIYIYIYIYISSLYWFFLVQDVRKLFVFPKELFLKVSFEIFVSVLHFGRLNPENSGTEALLVDR